MSDRIPTDALLSWLGLYALVGALLGAACLLVLVGLGYFAAPGSPFSGFGTTVAGSGVVLATVLVALSASFLLAVVVGGAANRTEPRRDDGGRASAVVGAVGHVVLVAALLVLLVVGFAVLNLVGGTGHVVTGQGGPVGGNLLAAAFLGLVFAALGAWASEILARGRLSRSD